MHHFERYAVMLSFLPMSFEDLFDMSLSVLKYPTIFVAVKRSSPVLFQSLGVFSLISIFQNNMTSSSRSIDDNIAELHAAMYQSYLDRTFHERPVGGGQRSRGTRKYTLNKPCPKSHVKAGSWMDEFMWKRPDETAVSTHSASYGRQDHHDLQLSHRCFPELPKSNETTKYRSRISLNASHGDKSFNKSTGIVVNIDVHGVLIHVTTSTEFDWMAHFIGKKGHNIQSLEKKYRCRILTS